MSSSTVVVDTGRRHSGRVLVVDDSRLVRVMVRNHLVGAGFEVEESPSGRHALETLSRSAFDAVITDLRMPDIDGFEVLASVKRRAPDTEVVILTGASSADLENALKALRLGAHDYLRKPLSSPDEVVLTLERAIEKKRLKDENRRLVRELERETRTDALTGVANRRALVEACGSEIARARRHGHGLGLVLADIDHFKAVNDTHGHQGGDEVLRAFSAAVGKALRAGDGLYRIGGEEFVVLCPHADARATAAVAERILRTVAAAEMRSGNAAFHVTTSAGVTSLRASDRDYSTLLARADDALYAAKRGGRNQVQVADAPALTLVSGGAC